VDNQTLIILAICGFLTVIVSVGILGLMTIFRFTGQNFMSFLGFLSRDARQIDDEGTAINVERRPDLRSIADQRDFDATLAKHLVIDQTQPPTQSAQFMTQSTQSTPPPAAPAAPTSSTPYNQPLVGTPKAPTILQGSIPGSGQTPPPPVTPVQAGAFSTPPPIPTTPDAGPWQDPSLQPRDFDQYRRKRDRDDEDDLLGGLVGTNNEDDGGLLG
jgi:hypothetical protein